MQHSNTMSCMIISGAWGMVAFPVNSYSVTIPEAIELLQFSLYTTFPHCKDYHGHAWWYAISLLRFALLHENASIVFCILFTGTAHAEHAHLIGQSALFFTECWNTQPHQKLKPYIPYNGEPDIWYYTKQNPLNCSLETSYYTIAVSQMWPKIPSPYKAGNCETVRDAERGSANWRTVTTVQKILLSIGIL